jgi:hypothetical protein
MAVPLFRHRARTTGASVSVGSKSWGGGVSSDWGTAANWVPFPTTVPISGDTVRFSTGENDVAGYDASAVSLSFLAFGASYYGKVGSSGTPLQINGEVLIINKILGAMFITGTWDEVYVLDTPGDPTAITFDGDIRNLYLLGCSGGVVIADNANVRKIYCTPSNNRFVKLSVGDSVVTDTGLHAFDMDLVRAYRLTEINAESGADQIILGDQALLTMTGDGASNNVVMHQATWDQRSSTKIDGRLTMLAGADFNLDNNVNATITIDDVSMYEGSRLDLANGHRGGTITNDIDYWGGEVQLDADRIIVIADTTSFSGGFSGGFS